LLRSDGSLCLTARIARCNVRWEAAVFVESDETTSMEISTALDAFRQLLVQIGGANIAGADRAWEPPTSSSLADDKSVSARSSSARRRAIRS